MRRATSDLYYALFHRLSEALVEPLGADPENPLFIETYLTLYRLPDHAVLDKKCKAALGQAFDVEVKRFAQSIVTMKNKRHDADYDPLKKFVISEVQNDLGIAAAALNGFDSIDAPQRARFAFFVALDAKRPK